MSGRRVSDADLVMYGEIGYGYRHGDADHNLPILAENIEAVVDELRDARFELRKFAAELATTQAALAEALAANAAAERRGMERAAKIADAYSDRPSVDAVRRAGAMNVAAAIRAAFLPPSDAAPAASEVRACQCRQCLRDRKERIGSFPAENSRMILCATCGNKRCPHATDHRLACTGSNEPGQVGSAYA